MNFFFVSKQSFLPFALAYLTTRNTFFLIFLADEDTSSDSGGRYVEFVYCDSDHLPQMMYLENHKQYLTYSAYNPQIAFSWYPNCMGFSLLFLSDSKMANGWLKIVFAFSFQLYYLVFR